MRTISVINMEKFQPGYLERRNFWARIDMGMIWDSGFSMLCETDQCRFIKFILIQVKTKKPILADAVYLSKFGMNFGAKGRRLNSTIRQLSEAELIEISETSEEDQTEIRGRSDRDQTKIRKKEPLPDKDLQDPLYIEKIRKEKIRVDGIKVIFKSWNDKKIVIHRGLEKYRSSINAALENYTVEEIINAIQNYKEILVSPDYFFTYEWSLNDFLSRKNGLDIFMSANNPFKKFTVTKNQTGYVSQADLNAGGQGRVIH